MSKGGDIQTDRQTDRQTDINSIYSQPLSFSRYIKKNVRFNPHKPSARVNQQESMPGSIHRSNGRANETDHVNIQRLNGNFASVNKI